MSAKASQRLSSIGLGLVIGGALAFVLWKRRHDQQIAEEAALDEKIILRDYECPLPTGTAQLLLDTLGSTKFRAYQHALPRAPAVTYVRVQFLPEEHVGQAIDDLAAGVEARVEEARLELEALLLGSAWESAHQPPRPLVQRHPIIPDVLVIPSAITSQDSRESLELNPKVVIVDRMCGEAVLKGSNVYCRGVLVASPDLEVGQEVELWADLGDFRNLKPQSTPTFKAKGSGKKGKAAGIGGSSGLEEEEAPAPPHTPAVLQGSALHKYCGRRVKLGRGVAEMGRSTMFRATSGLAVRLTALDGGLPAAPSLNGVLTKRFYAQNLPSAVCAHVLNPQPGTRVIDMCAAPGGKTTHLASLMLNSGELYALDHSRKKINELNALLQSLGYTCAKALYADAAACVLPLDPPPPAASSSSTSANDSKQAPSVAAPANKKNESKQAVDSSVTKTKNEATRVDVGTAKRVDRKARVAAARAKGKIDKHSAKKLATAASAAASSEALKSAAYDHSAKCLGFEAESFDSVLLDPPCSALGLRPRLRVDLSVSDVDEMVAAQRRIFWAAVMLLKPGGCLVFSTCTVSPQEDEGQVRHALATFPCLELIDAGGPFRVGDEGLPNDDISIGKSVFGPLGGLSESERAKVQRFNSCADPGADSVGFFVAKFRKTESVRVQGMKGVSPDPA